MMTECTECCRGRVVVVTGAGGGIGREYALELAQHGAAVVVNDLGTSPDGEQGVASVADNVVEEIRRLGGRAVSHREDIATWDGAESLIHTALEEFGRIDGLINNAGILRDRYLANLSESDWDDVIRVHLKGAFAPMRFAMKHWISETKAGREVDARIMNTTSPSGIFGNIGQSNYGAAKAGVAALTVIAAMEAKRFGITVNAIAPSARTRLTEHLPQSRSSGPVPTEGFDAASPANIAPLGVWLMSPMSRHVTGRVFSVQGGHIDIAEAWRAGPAIDREERWTVEELTDVIPGLVAEAQPNPDMYGRVERVARH